METPTAAEVEYAKAFGIQGLVAAIKEYRLRTGLGLKEAIEAFDAAGARMP